MFAVLIGTIILIVILVAVQNAMREDEDDRRRHAQMFLDVYDKTADAYDSESTGTVKRAIGRLDDAYQRSGGALGDVGRSMYEDERQELNEYAQELEYEKWEKKADDILRQLWNTYESVMESDYQDFSYIDTLYNDAKRCIRLLKRYYAIDLSKYDTPIDPRKYIREYMDEFYDPSMDDGAAFEEKMNERIKLMRPLYNRKTKLFTTIVNYVATHEPVARSVIFKTPFDGYTSKEVGTCYRALVKSGRLTEVKQGSRYYVSLSDKESAKRVRLKKA